MIRHFSKLDQYGDSTNGWVDLDDFPTRWFSASQLANFVSVHLIHYPCLSPFHNVIILHMLHLLFSAPFLFLRELWKLMGSCCSVPMHEPLSWGVWTAWMPVT